MVVVVFVVAGSRPSPVNLPTSVSCNDNGGFRAKRMCSPEYGWWTVEVLGDWVPVLMLK